MTERKKQSIVDILKGNVGVLIWTRFILFFPQNMYNQYFPLLVQEFGGSPQDIGFVQSMSSLAALIIVPIAGYLADFYSRVKLIASSFYLRSISFVIFFLSKTPASLAIGKFYDGLTEYNHAAQAAILADSLSPERRGTGFAMFNTFPNIVTNIAPIVGAFLITEFGVESGMKYIFIAAFVSMFIVGGSRQKFLKDTINKDTLDLKPAREGIPALVKKAYKSSIEALKWTPKNLRIFILIEGLASFTGGMVGPFWIIYAKEIIKLSVTDWALILSIEGVLVLILSVPAGMIVDKIESRKTILAMLSISLLPTVLFIYCKTFFETLAVMLATTVISSFMSPACMKWLANTVPRRLRARITSAYGRGGIGVRGGAGGAGGGYIIMIPALTGSMIGGFIYSINPVYPWLIQGGSLFTCLVLSALFLREPETAEL